MTTQTLKVGAPSSHHTQLLCYTTCTYVYVDTSNELCIQPGVYEDLHTLLIQLSNLPAKEVCTFTTHRLLTGLVTSGSSNVLLHESSVNFI